MCLSPGCPSTPRAPNTHDLACRKSRDEPVWRLRGGELVGGGPCQEVGVLRWGHSTRPGTFSSGRGRSTLAGTGILSPTASTVPARKDTHPTAQKCPRTCGPGTCGPVPDGVDCPRSEGPADGHPRATVGAESGRTTTRARTVTVRALGLERVTGIEPALSAWEAEVLPLNYTRVAPVDVRPRCVRKSNPDSGRLRKSACGGASGGRAGSALASRLSHGFPDVFIGVMSA